MTEAHDSGDDTPTANPTAPASFRVEVVQGRALVVASGEIDMTTASALREALANAAQVSARVVLDLTSVRFMDSSGIAVLLDALRAQKGRRGRPLVLAGAQNMVRRVLDITRVNRMVPTYDTVAEALDQAT
jgi:anti-sigma B factor antagonist